MDEPSVLWRRLQRVAGAAAITGLILVFSKVRFGEWIIPGFDHVRHSLFTAYERAAHIVPVGGVHASSPALGEHPGPLYKYVFIVGEWLWHLGLTESADAAVYLVFLLTWVGLWVAAAVTARRALGNFHAAGILLTGVAFSYLAPRLMASPELPGNDALVTPALLLALTGLLGERARPLPIVVGGIFLVHLHALSLPVGAGLLLYVCWRMVRPGGTGEDATSAHIGRRTASAVLLVGVTPLLAGLAVRPGYPLAYLRAVTQPGRMACGLDEREGGILFALRSILGEDRLMQVPADPKPAGLLLVVLTLAVVGLCFVLTWRDAGRALRVVMVVVGGGLTVSLLLRPADFAEDSRYLLPFLGLLWLVLACGVGWLLQSLSRANVKVGRVSLVVATLLLPLVAHPFLGDLSGTSWQRLNTAGEAQGLKLLEPDSTLATYVDITGGRPAILIANAAAAGAAARLAAAATRDGVPTCALVPQFAARALEYQLGEGYHPYYVPSPCPAGGEVIELEGLAADSPEVELPTVRLIRDENLAPLAVRVTAQGQGTCTDLFPCRNVLERYTEGLYDFRC